MGNSQVILSVVETLPNVKLTKELEEKIYQPSFWLPFIPIKKKDLKKIDQKTYTFEIEDTFQFDPLGTLSKHIRLTGKIIVDYKGEQGEKGKLWICDAYSDHPHTGHVKVRVRAKNTNKGLKIGIFLVEMTLPKSNLIEYGKDGILFVARTKIRESLNRIAQDLH